MFRLSIIKSKMNARRRSVLGVILLALMNATLQPCAMAMTTTPDSSSSETSPISTNSVHDSRQGHFATSAKHEMPACPRCPPSMSDADNECSVASMAQCDILPDVKQGEKILKVDLGDGHVNAQVSCHYFDLLDATALLTPVRPESLRPTFLIGPSLTIRHCVFTI